MVHHPAMEIQVGGELAGNHELAERAAHPVDRLVAVAAPHRELRDHRIVEDRTSAPAYTPASLRTPGPVGNRSVSIRPGAGTKPAAGSSA